MPLLYRARPRVARVIISYSQVYTIYVSPSVSPHEFITAHNRENKTMEERFQGLVGGPHPEDVAGILSSETAEARWARLGEEHETY